MGGPTAIGTLTAGKVAGTSGAKKPGLQCGNPWFKKWRTTGLIFTKFQASYDHSAGKRGVSAISLL